MIEHALSPSRRWRLRALATSERTLASGCVARDLLLSDEDAHVRAAAARFIGRCKSSLLAPALRDALYDEMPLVRHASVLALARLKDPVAEAPLARHAVEDPIWWVRRAALLALTRMTGAAAVPVLRSALDDPFWRVRHASVEALVRVSRRVAVDGLLATLGQPESSRARGALTFLRRRLGFDPAFAGERTPANAEATRSPADPDPAVVTARLNRGEPASEAFLAECLADPHSELRRAASARLSDHADERALAVALLWLEEPRIPHAACTVFALLDSLDPARVAPLLDRALREGPDGAAVWALSSVAEHGDQSRLEQVIRLTQARSNQVRRAAISSAGRLFRSAHDRERIVAVLEAARTDSDADVARIAAGALMETALPEVLTTLAHEAPSTDVIVRRLQVEAAAIMAIPSRLLLALADDDSMTRARAASVLGRSGLDPETRGTLERDQDPWVRMAVVSPATAESSLEHDPYPPLRRAAFQLVADRRKAAVVASGAADPWLRSRSAALLDGTQAGHLRRLLAFTRDLSKTVRSAAWEALGRQQAEDARGVAHALKEILSTERDPEIRIAAHAVRARALDGPALESLGNAVDMEGPQVREWIRDVLGGVAGAAPPQVTPVAPAPIVRSKFVRRQLGRTGLDISPVALSGAGDLSELALSSATEAGCNLFFWESRYRTMTRFLRRTPQADAVVIAGSFQACERGIVTDVERALRRLRRDTLDVFLLFWARSPARLEGESLNALARLKAAGKIRSAGFSTHDRELACSALLNQDWDVVMVRHSAAHPGAEERLFPIARQKGVGVLTFSALCYGRLLSEDITAAEAYRYSLAQVGVSAVISAPRRRRELRENLEVLKSQELSAPASARLRSRGQTVRVEDRDFNELLRRYPLRPPDTDEAWDAEAERAPPELTA